MFEWGSGERVGVGAGVVSDETDSVIGSGDGEGEALLSSEGEDEGAAVGVGAVSWSGEDMDEGGTEGMCEGEDDGEGNDVGLCAGLFGVAPCWIEVGPKVEPRVGSKGGLTTGPEVKDGVPANAWTTAWVG